LQLAKKERKKERSFSEKSPPISYYYIPNSKTNTNNNNLQIPNITNLYAISPLFLITHLFSLSLTLYVLSELNPWLFLLLQITIHHQRSDFLH